MAHRAARVIISPRRGAAGRAALRASRPASGIWLAADELEAGWLLLLDQGHCWGHKLLIGSVIVEVLRCSQVPVLLLPLASD